MFYLGCTVCRKKVVEMQRDKHYRCDNCDKYYPSCEPNYAFSSLLVDFTDSQYLSFMGDVGEEATGMSVREFRDVVDKDFDKAVERV